MITAKDMRALAEQSQKDSTIEWFKNYKEILLAEIKKRATSGDFELTIDKQDKLNEFSFISCERLRSHLIKEMGHLGYEVAYSQGMHYSDGNDKSITIKW